jgi:hypothetical protein
MDYRKFSDLERYLFEEVGPRFRSSDVIEPVDLFMIFIWKANRAKTKTRDKLKKLADGSFAVATGRIAAALSASEDRKERLGILMRDWELRLPMASAILTVLYPEEFTVYDWRVCKMLSFPYKESRFSERRWLEYESYKGAVLKSTPSGLSLRDSDRFLWGKSLREDAQRDAQ